MKYVNQVRLTFLRELLRAAQVIWPIISGIFIVIAGLGGAVSYLEGWPLRDGVYFAFVTALTVGYGDLTATHLLSRCLAIVIGFVGIAMAALLAGVSMRALQTAQEQMQRATVSPPKDAN